ncbi:MAG: hypothetical protein QM703_24125 [Gemmatales bacterium]
MSESIHDQIIAKIRRNRISTTEVADCLDKSGVIEGVYPLNRGMHRAGRVFWTYVYNESNWELHEQIRHLPEGRIVLTEAFNCKHRAIYGDLVSKFMILYRQSIALVCAAPLRDASNLIRENWPVWLTGTTPIGCFNVENKVPLDPKIVEEHRARFHDAIAVCDDSGVVVIPHERINAEFLEKLDWIEEQEDIWFDCIDRRKWDTYDTVCLKKYKDNPLPKG